MSGATIDDLEVTRANLARICPYDMPWMVERRNRLDATLAEMIAALKRGEPALVFKLVAPDTFEIGAPAAPVRYTLTRPAFRAAHAAIRGDAAAPVSEFVSARKSNPSTRLRNQIARARVWLAPRCAPLALAFGYLRVQCGVVVYRPPADAPRIATE